MSDWPDRIPGAPVGGERDPNADLIDKSFTYEDGWVYTVTQTTDWSDQYVWGTVHNPENGHIVPKVTKPAGLVRERIRKDTLDKLVELGEEIGYE